MGAVVIEPIACLRDNYAYLIYEPGTKDGWIVDPSEADPPRRALARHGLSLRGILATHHHSDHVGGIAELLAAAEAPAGGGQAPPVWVAGHAADRARIPRQTAFVDAPAGGFARSGLEIAERPVLAMHIPGHTRAAIAWGIPAERGGDTPMDVFTGDTLFGAGCGRLFEGTPAQMFASLRGLTALPEATRLWFGHEYTASNLRFAATVEPDNPAVAERLTKTTGAGSTTPTTVALERATNPFVRASSVEELAARRAAKDRF
jgi:hydroxyacylglutathione hydrolase